MPKYHHISNGAGPVLFRDINHCSVCEETGRPSASAKFNDKAPRLVASVRLTAPETKNAQVFYCRSRRYRIDGGRLRRPSHSWWSEETVPAWARRRPRSWQLLRTQHRPLEREVCKMEERIWYTSVPSYYVIEL
jgi:hypothetical protein